MAKMTYEYKEYYFEHEDGRILLPQDEYFMFVENCKQLIQKDMDNNEAKRKELAGFSK